jgi:hypothetical protein
MVGRNPRYELDIIAVKILEKKYPFSLIYTRLVDEINLRFEGKNPSTATFRSHLVNLCDRDILNKERDRYGGTHYSLTKEFKDLLDIQKNNYPIAYVEKTLYSHQFSGYLDSFGSEADSEKAIEIIDDESSDDKKT